MSSSSSESLRANALLRLRDGDTEALAELFDTYRDRLALIVSGRMDRRLAGRVDVDDVLQEAYMDAASRIHHFVNSHSGSFFIWLRMITTQTMSNIFRRHVDAQKRDATREISIHAGKTYESPRSPIALQLLGQLTSPSRAAMREEAAQELEAMIASMKPNDREIIALRHFEQLDNKEIAEVLGIHEKAASIRYVRALARLKELMAELTDGVGPDE